MSHPLPLSGQGGTARGQGGSGGGQGGGRFISRMCLLSDADAWEGSMCMPPSRSGVPPSAHSLKQSNSKNSLLPNMPRSEGPPFRAIRHGSISVSPLLMQCSRIIMSLNVHSGVVLPLLNKFASISCRIFLVLGKLTQIESIWNTMVVEYSVVFPRLPTVVGVLAVSADMVVQSFLREGTSELVLNLF